MQDNTITDVEFKEVAAAPIEFFNPVTYLINALQSAGHKEPNAWTLDLDPRAETVEDEKERIFFTNRAVRLYMAEQTERENITARLLLADGIDKIKYCALVEQAIVPWLMGEFDEKGKRVEEATTNVAPTLEEFPASLDLDEEEKAQLREFFASENPVSLTIGHRTFMTVHRNGATGREWFDNDNPNVHFPLPYKEYAAESFTSSTEETDLADKINSIQGEQITGNRGDIPGVVPQDEFGNNIR